MRRLWPLTVSDNGSGVTAHASVCVVESSAGYALYGRAGRRRLSKGRERSRECACPESCRLSYQTDRTNIVPHQSPGVVRLLDVKRGKPRAALKRWRAESSPTPRRVCPAPSAHPQPLSLFCHGMLRAACCHSGIQGAAAVCACSAITRARARGARRSGPAKWQFGSWRSYSNRGVAKPASARDRSKRGAGRTETTAQAAELGVVFLDLGWCNRCLVGGGCVFVSSPAPSCTQRNAACLIDDVPHFSMRPPG